MSTTPRSVGRSAAARTSTSTTASTTADVGGAAIAGAAVFLAAYLAVDPVAGALADRSLPFDGTTAEIAAYYVANPAAAVVGAALQVVSVLGFAVFARSVRPALGTAGRRLNVVAAASVGAMLVSAAATAVIAGLAPSVSADTVGVLRQVSFYAGGVANVATLGFFAFAASRILGSRGLLGRPTRVLGYVAGTLAMLSVLSIAFFYASALLPAGRVLSMVWTVVAAVVLFRRTRR
ncbi:hypothetical protein GCM10027063_17690 [Promicromonospora xylanilytica]